jgi:hypothetical protein
MLYGRLLGSIYGSPKGGRQVHEMFASLYYYAFACALRFQLIMLYRYRAA